MRCVNAPARCSTSLRQLATKKVEDRIFVSGSPMPTISERQALIDTVILAGEYDIFSTVDDELGQEDPDYEMDSPQPESSSDSSTCSSSTCSSNTSTSSSNSSLDGSVHTNTTDEEHTSMMAGMADLLQVIMATRVLNPHEVAKCSQLHLILVDFKASDLKRFRQNLRVSPSTFDSLLKRIENDPIFYNNSYTSQIPVHEQLAITLFRLGHDGNAASVIAVAQWAGVSSGAVVKCTRRVMVAFLALHDAAIHWPTEEEKEQAKEWVESVSCAEWRDGFCMVDGTLVPLSQKPGHHGEAYFDRKSNYSLNVQVMSLRLYLVMVIDIFW